MTEKNEKHQLAQNYSESIISVKTVLKNAAGGRWVFLEQIGFLAMSYSE